MSGRETVSGRFWGRQDRLRRQVDITGVLAHWITHAPAASATPSILLGPQRHRVEGEATIDADRLARHVAGLARDEERNEGRHLLRLSEAPSRQGRLDTVENRGRH